MAYTTPESVAKQIGKPALAGPPVDPKLQSVCDGAEQLINDWIGVTASLDPVPPTVSIVAQSLAIDLWKQADATFGIVGNGETGVVRIARDLLNRYDSLLIPFYDSVNGWGVA